MNGPTTLGHLAEGSGLPAGYNVGMCEFPTLRRRWFPFGLVVASVAIVPLLNFSAPAFADDTNAALPVSVTKRIIQVLPNTWTYESKNSRLVLRPRKRPVFVNLVNGEGRRPNETLDDYHRRHTVNFDYRIVLRFEPKLSFRQVSQLVDENWVVHHSLQALEQSPLALPLRGSTSFPETPEGLNLSQQRDQLLKSFRSVPAGYLDNMSVYVEPTYLGFATFLRDEDRQIAEGVEKRIREQLTLYSSEPTAAPPADKE